MVFFEPRGMDGAALQAALRERGVLCSGTPDRIRMVTHLDVTTAQIDEAIAIAAEVVAELTGG